MAFGDRLRQIRENRGMTQERLAHVIGLRTKAAISKIEKGITDPNQSTIKKLADALGVSPLDFFEGYSIREYARYEEYLPYLAQADEAILKSIRILLNMPLIPDEKKENGSSTSKAIS